MAERDRTLAREARVVAIVIAAATLGWIVLQELGRQYGWQWRYVFLFDLAAIAAYVWALAVTWRIWRLRRKT
ncbi:MAG: DUF5337 domain-containing protein [Gemmobacter sp.]